MATETTETQVPEGYVYVCERVMIPPRGRKTVIINDTRVLIVATETGLYAVEDRCPQTGRSIAHGKVLENTIITPTNGARYDLATGRYLEGGQSWFQSHWLTTYPVKIVGDKLYVRPPQA